METYFIEGDPDELVMCAGLNFEAAKQAYSADQWGNYANHRRFRYRPRWQWYLAFKLNLDVDELIDKKIYEDIDWSMWKRCHKPVAIHF